jgi:pSer/pThr/pTyr-binding forkhead associated (FHA) protein
MARSSPGILIHKGPDGVEIRHQLREDVITLGRSDTCVITIPLPTVSRLHARIEVLHDRYVLFDAGSANGTFVDGKRIDQAYQLSTGETIWLGSDEVSLVFTDPEETLVMKQGTVVVQPLFIDEDARTVKVYNQLVQLSPLEYSLLLHLANNPGTVCTREGCFLTVWGHPYDHATCEDALNACIAKLRRNLRAAAHAVGREPPSITTVQRVGFRLDEDVGFASRNDRQSERNSSATSELTREVS